jgi:CheY-like chemotaxis protein
MPEKPLPVVAVVDDDTIYQFTAKRTLQLTQAASDILSFSSAETALAYLKENKTDAGKLPAFLFLDINMPVMDGWMFLDDFEALLPELARPVTVFMVSSSIDPKDVARANAHPRIARYLTKPISMHQFSELIGGN